MKETVRIVCPKCDADFPVMQEEITAGQEVSCPDCEYEASAKSFRKLIFNPDWKRAYCDDCGLEFNEEFEIYRCPECYSHSVRNITKKEN